MDTQIIVVISIQLIGFTILAFKVFGKSYLEEKGKNLATKEDIKQITISTEEARKSFTESLELLKGRLDSFNANFLSIKELERNALIEINNKYSDWLHSLHDFSLVYYSYDNFEILKSKDLYFGEKILAFNIAEDNLHLYVHDRELLSIKKELVFLTFQLHGLVLTNINTFILNCKNYNDNKGNSDEEKLAFNKYYHSIQEPIIQQSIAEGNEVFLKIHEKQIDFIKYLNYKIYNLITTNQ